MSEEWRNVPGLEWLYQVSNYGRFAKIKHGKRCLLKPTLSCDGYYRVTFIKNGRQKMVLLHRVIAEVFVPKYGPSEDVNHIDGDKTNNNVDNLEWCTKRKNCIHRTRVLKHAVIAIPKKPVLCVETGEIFDSLRMAAMSTIRMRCDSSSKKIDGISSHIRDCCKKKYGRRTCCGYHWEFIA